MSQVFKVVKEFEFEGEMLKTGTEIALTAREGDKLVREKFVVHVDRELDPAVKKDKDLLDKCENRKASKHAENFSEEKAEERQAEVDEREAKRDEAAKAKAAEVAEAGADVEDEDEESEEEAAEELPQPKRRRRTTG